MCNATDRVTEPDEATTKARWFFLGFASFVMVALAACSGGDDPETGPTAPAVPDPHAPTTTVSHPDPDETGPDDASGLIAGDEFGYDSGRFAVIHLMPGAGEAGIGKVAETVQAVVSRSGGASNIEAREPIADVMFDPGFVEEHPDLLACFRYGAAPVIEVELEEPDPELLQSVADAVRGHPAVLSVESFGMDLGYGIEIPEQEAEQGVGPDEYLAITCDRNQVWVLTDPGLDEAARTTLAEQILSLEAVEAVIIEKPFEGDDFFQPDLSDYPEMAACHGPEFFSIQAIIPQGDRASSSQVVDAFIDRAGVLGFFGPHVAPSLDPMLAFEGEMEANFELCERMTAFVELLTEISDEEAAVVVARALDVPGVADVELNLFEPAPAEECEEFEGHGDVEGEAPPDALGVSGGGSLNAVTPGGRNLGAQMAAFSPVIDPCFVPETSSLTIYRGDPNLASQQVIADALCDLPGVISISSFDEMIMDLDPYTSCQELRLEVRFDFDATESARQHVRDLLAASPLVVDIFDYGEFAEEEGFEMPIPDIVVGDLDLFACFPEAFYETGSVIDIRLARVTEHEAHDLAGRVESMPGVAGVFGNASGRTDEESHEDCGAEFLSFWFTPESTASQRESVFAVFSARPDVLAVVLIEEDYEDAHVGTPSGTVDVGWSGSVIFTSEAARRLDLAMTSGAEPALDLDSLIDQVLSMPGVAYAESFLLEGDEFHGDVFEGEEDEEDFVP